MGGGVHPVPQGLDPTSLLSYVNYWALVFPNISLKQR